MKTFQEYLDAVNQAIAAIPYPASPDQLYEPIAYHMALGGKRVRPVLTLMACDAMGGDSALAIDAALGLEMFHNFTLLHDDVMDNADVRRGKPTVHCRWNDNTAILSGDTMLTIATQYIARTANWQVMDLFNKTAIEIYEGQQWDMDYENRNDVTVEEYINMIRLKTSVLLGCALKTGALIADADEQQASLIYEAGVNMGLAFQLRDDVLDVWGNPETFGKEIGGDIMNNKKTFLLINTMQLAQGDDADELRHWLNDPYATRDDKVRGVTSLYERLGVRQLAEEAISRYNDQAVAAFNQLKISDDDKAAFIALANRLSGRKY
ncbi:MAG: polyprenyl synthetase family protein [Muribaculaceae bacterium]|nr:polyprenyl synthetase family protein [Muribaculaceae bacterium]